MGYASSWVALIAIRRRWEDAGGGLRNATLDHRGPILRGDEMSRFFRQVGTVFVSLALAACTSGPSPTPASSTDPADPFQIEPPYALNKLDDVTTQAAETAFKQHGFMSDLYSMGMRQVTGGTGLSYLFVVKYPPGALDDNAYDGVLESLSQEGQGQVSETTTAGIQVASARTTEGAVALFRKGDELIQVLSLAFTDAVPIADAMIAANP
jgi:hypothetical protein